MKLIIFEVSVLILCVAFVLFLAFDDRKNRQRRLEEDRLKEQQQQETKTGSGD